MLRDGAGPDGVWSDRMAHQASASSAGAGTAETATDRARMGVRRGRAGAPIGAPASRLRVRTESSRPEVTGFSVGDSL
jgi:hypothetical protein